MCLKCRLVFMNFCNWVKSINYMPSKQQRNEEQHFRKEMLIVQNTWNNNKIPNSKKGTIERKNSNKKCEKCKK